MRRPDGFPLGRQAGNADARRLTRKQILHAQHLPFPAKLAATSGGLGTSARVGPRPKLAPAAEQLAVLGPRLDPIIDQEEKAALAQGGLATRSRRGRPAHRGRHDFSICGGSDKREACRTGGKLIPAGVEGSSVRRRVRHALFS